MKRFRFSLEKVLRYKKLLKEERRSELLKANQAFFEHKKELGQLQNQLFDCQRKLLAGKLSPAILIHRASLIDFWASRVLVQEQKTKAALAYVRECTERLVQAYQEEQVLEKLKERKHREYRYFVELDLQKELDEVAASAFSRRG